MNFVCARTLRVWILLLALQAGCTQEQVVEALVTTYYGYNGQFHLAGCSAIQNVENRALAKFTSRDAAVGAGLTPCPVCNP